MRRASIDLGWLGLGIALLGIVATLASARSGMVLGVIAILVSFVAIRNAVRTDLGLARALFALGFGFIALVAGTFVYGHQRGGQIIGAPAPAPTAVVTAAVTV